MRTLTEAQLAGGEIDILLYASETLLEKRYYAFDTKQFCCDAQMRPFVDHPIHYETALAATCAALGATHYVGFYLVMEPGSAETAPLEVISPLATRSELVRALRGRRAAGGATC